ncbi:MAG TPA: pseudaminic acid synthase [Dysgonomonas sp.]|uniref:pseudaminic acid synthase n=1 Tax=Dysgonomonas TaxID=156973 RepID=UPI0025C73250|nr:MULTISPECIES: pseudaminic acid synthase [Dysgonomonas]MBS5908494.1 pseudaminic acid synthase [Dysgonomonas mossii]HML63304.1 pseudaminic acid synthase [Dysgonomonas sp.]
MNKSNTFIIAELSANHNNDFNLAVNTIQAMAKAGADAVKIQTYKPQSLTLNLDTGYFAPRSEGLWKGYTPWNLFEEASMPYQWQPQLKKIAEDLGLIFFSSPFDIEGVDFLESIDIPIYKVASFEITDIPLIEHIASKGKPMIISTGVAELGDIDLAIKACRKMGNNDITLLKCTSEYPATIEKANLLTIKNLKETFNVKVGVSDHTLGSTVPVVSVALGATVVEKHFILDRSMGGPDASFSMEPNEFYEMVSAVREAEQSLGIITYDISEKDKSRRRSLFVTEDIKEGDFITVNNVRSIRPGYGLHPKYLPDILGKKVNRNIKKGEPFSFDFLQ